MQLHQIGSTRQKKTQRIGRGGKRGSYSGRGVKGQASRSGRRLRPAERDLIIRLPKRRGFANKPKSAKAHIFNLGELSNALKLLKAKGPFALTVDVLKAAGLLPMRFRGEVKLLGDGEVSAALNVSGIKVSENARKKIVRAGGKVNE